MIFVLGVIIYELKKKVEIGTRAQRLERQSVRPKSNFLMKKKESLINTSRGSEGTYFDKIL